MPVTVAADASFAKKANKGCADEEHIYPGRRHLHSTISHIERRQKNLGSVLVGQDSQQNDIASLNTSRAVPAREGQVPYNFLEHTSEGMCCKKEANNGEIWRATGGRQSAALRSGVKLVPVSPVKSYCCLTGAKKSSVSKLPAKDIAVIPRDSKEPERRLKTSREKNTSGNKEELQLDSSPGMVYVQTVSKKMCFHPPPHYLNVGYYQQQPLPGYMTQPQPPLYYLAPYCHAAPLQQAQAIASTNAEGKPKFEDSRSESPISAIAVTTVCSTPDRSTKSYNTGKMVHAFSPPSLCAGANYLFHRDHTELHIFSKAAEIWQEKYRGVRLEFKEFKVATNFTVKNVIERIVAQTADKALWAASEVIEIGGGEWRQGSTIEYASDKAKCQLVDIGWNSKRGKELPPVWLCIHKINE